MESYVGERIVTAIEDPNILGEFFRDESWDTWKAIIRGIFALPVDEKQASLFKEATGRTAMPEAPVSTVTWVAGRRCGKALSLDTEIPTTDGYKFLEDLEEGDYVFGSDGAPTKVKHIHPTEYDRPCYKLWLSNTNEPIIADENHEWLTYTKSNRKNARRGNEREKNGSNSLYDSAIELRNTPPEKLDVSNFKYSKTSRMYNLEGVKQGSLTFMYPVKFTGSHEVKWYAVCDCGIGAALLPSQNKTKTICDACRVVDTTRPTNKTTKEISNSLEVSTKNEKNHSIPVASPIQGEEKNLPVDPYVLGIWLGDGSKSGAEITTMDQEVVDDLQSKGYFIQSTRKRKDNGKATTYGISRLFRALRVNNLLKNKHIPYEYFTSSFEQRVELLKGLLDSDGSIEKKNKEGFGVPTFWTTDSQLANDVVKLVSSLGIRASKSYKEAKLYGVNKGTCYDVTIPAHFPVFKIPRKKDYQIIQDKQSPSVAWRYITSVEKTESVPVKCITVENEDGLFQVTQNHILTHNSRIISAIAVSLATLVDWEPYRVPGELTKIVALSQDREQAQIIFSYCRAFIEGNPLLYRMVDTNSKGDPAITKEEITLKNGITIGVHTASFRSVRGYTAISVIADELAFWSSDDSANPDKAILNAVRPSLATIPNSMLLMSSSPYDKKGVLYENYKNYYGVDDDEHVVVNMPSWRLNPTLPMEFIEREYKNDPESAKAEYGAEFRSGVSNPITPEIVDSATIEGRYELSPDPDVENYIAFTDPSGGSQDAFTLSIGHVDDETKKIIIDMVREVKPPFDPESVVTQFVKDMKRYGVDRVMGDRYGGEWVSTRFEAEGVTYEVSKKTRSELYQETIPALNSGDVELLDNDKIKKQFTSLERKSGGANKDRIDHPRGGEDDVVNSVAGVIAHANVDAPIQMYVFD